MGRKKKLLDLDQVHGKLEPENGEYEPTTLSQVFGESNGSEKYNTLDIEKYKSQLDDLNVAELRTHAIEVARVVPSSNTERLKTRLISEFQKHVSQFTQAKIKLPKDKEPSKEVLKIMSEVK